MHTHVADISIDWGLEQGKGLAAIPLSELFRKILRRDIAQSVCCKFDSNCMDLLTLEVKCPKTEVTVKSASP
jgi:hypothetical protein